MTRREHSQTAHWPACGCEGEAGVLVGRRGGYNLGSITCVSPWLVLINANGL